MDASGFGALASHLPASTVSTSLLSGRSRAGSGYRPDVDALAEAPTRVVVIAVGEESDGTFAGRTAVATAELLGQQATVFPSHHGGEFGYAGQPEALRGQAERRPRRREPTATCRIVRMSEMEPALAVVPANEASCRDLQTVFGERGAASRCQCQRYKLRPRESFAAFAVEDRADRLRRQTGCSHREAGTTSGLVAYLEGEPVGWCAVEPRTAYTGLLRT